jgi:hypothetical protein
VQPIRDVHIIARIGIMRITQRNGMSVLLLLLLLLRFGACKAINPPL